MWVLGLHKVHGEESIVVLLVHGEFSSSSCGSTPPWFILVLSCSLHQPIVHLFSFLFTLSLITSFFTWRTISLLLNKVHSNLKLPLLTLTTNGSFLFLVLLSSLNLSLSDFLRVDISSASDSSIL
ncbi:unnamed protein product [Microthlaspi erraticum]|uniref:Uncharacterized protein n=1 Tax=Microthlaspi erraticum TaxID=1685480 RepID=A0A6D2HKY1_9BRAS|nr:unnamed protein product [Microthlaspi erraticum]